MLGRDRRQASLLDRYWALLRRNRRAAPPAGLDPEIADLAAQLERNLAAPAPSSAYAENMRRRLNVQADRLAAGETLDLPTRQSGATRQNGSRPMTPTQLQPRERRPMQPTAGERAESGQSPDAPIPLPHTPWYSEYGKLAAAIAIFAVVGIILVLVLRDNDDEQTAQPLPTPTEVSSFATLVPTPPTAAAPTPTVAAIAPTAVPPTATVPAVPVLGEAFSVSVTDVVIPEGYAYLDIERLGWQPSAGSAVNAITLGSFLSYQEAGTEACGMSPSNSSEAKVYRADGSEPETISNFDQPPTLVNPGDHVFLPVNSGFNCSNAAAEPSLAWAGGVLRQDPGPSTGHQRNPESVAPGSLDAVVAGADAPGLPAGEVTLTLERIIIEPGDAVPGGEPAWTLIYAESGALSVSVGGATEELAEGESTLVVGEAGYELANGGDAAIAVIVFTVLPEGPEASSISARLEALPEGSDYISLERHTWKSFGFTSEQVVVPGPMLAYQDTSSWKCVAPSGPITLIHADGSIEAMSADDVAPSEVSTGDGFVMADSGSYHCVNGGSGDATQYQFAIYSGGTTGFDRTVPDGITLAVLAGGPVADLPAGPVALSIERVIVEPGASVPSVAGVAATIFIESGTANLSGTVGGETVMHEFVGSTEMLPTGVEAELVANDGVTLPINNAATITNTSAEPLVVIIATIVPAG